MEFLKKYFTSANFLFFAIVGISIYFFSIENIRDFFTQEYGEEINNVLFRDKAIKDKVINVDYNSDHSAYLETVTARSLRVKSKSAIGIYLFVSNTLGLIIFFVLFWFLVRMLRAFGNDKSFGTNLDKVFYRIGILLLILGALSYLDQLIISQFLKRNGFADFRVKVGNAVYFFFAFIAFAFMSYYAAGKELSEESELTI